MTCAHTMSGIFLSVIYFLQIIIDTIANMQISDTVANPGNVGGDIPDSLPSVANFVVCFGVASIVVVGTVSIPAPPGPAL